MNQKIPESLLIYGDPLTGKTTQIGNIARWVYETTGKKTRLISCEGGGMAPLDETIQLGILDYIIVEGRDDLLPVLQDLARGDWIIDGKWAKVGQSGNDLSQIGLYVVEGMKYAAETFKTSMLGKGINFTDRDLVTDFAMSNSDTKEKRNYGVPIQAHYGVSQSYLVQIISAFKTGVLTKLAPESRRLIFTTHTYESELDPSRKGSKNRVGPATTGGALTKSIVALFSQSLHLTSEQMRESSPGEKGKGPIVRSWTEHRAWFKDHRDRVIPDVWNAALRFSTPQIKLLKDDPLWLKGYMIIEEDDEEGVVKLLKWQEEVRARSVEMMALQIKEEAN